MSTRHHGNLNRLRGTVKFVNTPTLDLVAEDLGTEGIRLAFDNVATDLLPTMAGMVSGRRAPIRNAPSPSQSSRRCRRR